MESVIFLFGRFWAGGRDKAPAAPPLDPLVLGKIILSNKLQRLEATGYITPSPTLLKVKNKTFLSLNRGELLFFRLLSLGTST